MSVRIIPAIMSGGAGTRLWPLSTEAHPKQFHTLGGERSLFAETLARVADSPGALEFAAPLILCNARHKDLVRENLAGTDATLVLEPAQRNTAAVSAFAAAVSAEIDANALVLLLPADHIVADVGAFHAAIARAAPFARDRIVTFGITPDRPATGYGYIKCGAELGEGVFAIDAFREKPNEATARGYLAASGCVWNAGIFLFDPRMLLAEFDVSADIRDAALAALSAAKRSPGELVLDADAFARVRAAPFDVAVMEKTTRAAVVPCDIGWADIGSWDEVWRLAKRDAHGNGVLGPAAASDVAKITESGLKARALPGEDLVAVATPVGILIVPRAQANDAAALKLLSDSL